MCQNSLSLSKLGPTLVNLSPSKIFFFVPILIGCAFSLYRQKTSLTLCSLMNLMILMKTKMNTGSHPRLIHSRCALNDVDEVRKQGGSTDKKAINIRTLDQFVAATPFV